MLFMSASTLAWSLLRVRPSGRRINSIGTSTTRGSADLAGLSKLQPYDAAAALVNAALVVASPLLLLLLLQMMIGLDTAHRRHVHGGDGRRQPAASTCQWRTAEACIVVAVLEGGVGLEGSSGN
jgi:hypothetical protein